MNCINIYKKSSVQNKIKQKIEWKKKQLKNG